MIRKLMDYILRVVGACLVIKEQARQTSWKPANSFYCIYPDCRCADGGTGHCVKSQTPAFKLAYPHIVDPRERSTKTALDEDAGLYGIRIEKDGKAHIYHRGGSDPITETDRREKEFSDFIKTKRGQSGSADQLIKMAFDAGWRAK